MYQKSIVFNNNVKTIYLGLSLGLFFVAGKGTPLGAAALPPAEIGGEYQLNITRTDDGLVDKEIKKPYPTTSLNLKGLKFSFKGQFTEDISWFLLYKAKETELERFFLTHKVSDQLTLIAGKQKIKVYGMHRKLVSGVSTPLTAAYLDQNPLKDKTALDLTYKIAGTLSLQMVEDYSKCTALNTCTSYNRGSDAGTVANSRETQTTQKQPAFAFEWLGALGDFSPLVQYAVYDLGKSRTFSAGIRFKNEKVDTYFDMTVDTRHLKGSDPADPSRSVDQKNVYRGAVFYGETKVASKYTPFVHASSFESQPYEKPDISEKDKTALLANTQGKLDKNERTLGIGTHYDGWGAFYRPYLLALYGSGRFVDPKDETQKKTLAKTDLVFGVIGKF